MIKITRILCTVIACILVFYDLFVVATTHSIVGSISAWFNSFSVYWVPVFGLSFVLGHVFSDRAIKGATHPRMVRYKFWITCITIGATLYDIIVTQFFNYHYSISMMTQFWTTYAPDLKLSPFMIVIMGLIAGKFLGTMSPTNPQGQGDEDEQKLTR